MFRSLSRKSLPTAFRKTVGPCRIQRLIFAAVLLACPCGILAQHGGGGHGGGSVGGGGMNGGGRASGVDVKDDLKDFHAALAVQATSQQIIQYALMLKSTAAATTELQALLQQLDKKDNSREPAAGRTPLADALEKARTDNKKFMDGLSGPQKSGLKEVTRKLTKADAELAQQARVLDQQAADAKVASPQTVSTAQSLDHALTNFRQAQIGLGEEMGIEDSSHNQDFAFNLPTVRTSLSFQNQPIAITTSGVISKGVAEGEQNTFTLELTADLSELQQNIDGVLHAQLDQSPRCGERIEIQDATLTPSGAASVVAVQLHFERWACLGRDANEMAEGNGTITVKLIPAVAEDGSLRMAAEIVRIDAAGLIGDLLRSGPLGEAVRDKISESILYAVRQSVDFKMTLPLAAQANAVLRRAQFQGTGSGRLAVVLDGEIRVSNENAASFTGDLKTRSSSHENAQDTAPR